MKFYYFLQKKQITAQGERFLQNKKIFSIFPGSRISEINVLIPILFKFVKKMNEKYGDIFFIFHSTSENVQSIQNLLNKQEFKNCAAISDDKIKSHILKSSIFAVAKSGTVSLEICNSKIPSIIIYNMWFVNFYIIPIEKKICGNPLGKNKFA